MKNNLLSAAALALALVAAIVWNGNTSATPNAAIALPVSAVSAPVRMPEILLPEVTISAKQQQINTILLPEVVISAKKYRKA